MPKFIEQKLEKEYPNNPHAVFGTMNKIGAMHGNKETAKGRRMEEKHESKKFEKHESKKHEMAEKMKVKNNSPYPRQALKIHNLRKYRGEGKVEKELTNYKNNKQFYKASGTSSAHFNKSNY